MLLEYDIVTNKVISATIISQDGASNVTPDEIKSLHFIDLPNGSAELHVFDKTDIEVLWSAHSAANVDIVLEIVEGELVSYKFTALPLAASVVG